jgi:hypothetical protein
MKALSRYEADYFECLQCGCLQIPNPHWLNETYCDEDKPIAGNPDGGCFCRPSITLFSGVFSPQPNPWLFAFWLFLLRPIFPKLTTPKHCSYYLVSPAVDL